MQEGMKRTHKMKIIHKRFQSKEDIGTLLLKRFRFVMHVNIKTHCNIFQIKIAICIYCAKSFCVLLFFSKVSFHMCFLFAYLFYLTTLPYFAPYLVLSNLPTLSFNDPFFLFWCVVEIHRKFPWTAAMTVHRFFPFVQHWEFLECS